MPGPRPSNSKQVSKRNSVTYGQQAVAKFSPSKLLRLVLDRSWRRRSTTARRKSAHVAVELGIGRGSVYRALESAGEAGKSLR